MSSGNPYRLERFLLLALLTSLALVQPLFDLLGKQAEFLVAHSLEGTGLVSLVVILAIGVPLLPGVLLLGLGLFLPKFARSFFHSLVIILSALVALPFLSSTGMHGSLIVLLALAIGLLVLLIYRRFSPVRLFFKFLTPAILIFPLVFLLASRASPLVFPAGDESRFRTATLETSPDIVFLVLDEFPLVSLLDARLHIDPQQFPNFARLAAMSDWYPGATTGAEVTTYAVPEALTGVESDPAEQRLPITANYPDNLFALLAGRYEMLVMETATRLCPRTACTTAENSIIERHSAIALINDLLVVYAHLVTPQPWARKLPSISDGWSGFERATPGVNGYEPALERALSTAELSRQIDWRSRAGQFRHFISQLERGAKARLFYLHTLLPHRIWQYLPDGRQYLVNEVWEALDPPQSRPADLGNGQSGHAWQSDKWAVSVARQRHILQVRFVDLLLGEMLDRLEARGMLEDSMLVVMGDHGAGFVPGKPLRVISTATLNDIAAVPLFIKRPGQTVGNTVNGPARLTDILPTILELLNIRPEAPLSGVSLADKPPPPRASVSVKNEAGQVLSYPFTEHMQQLVGRAGQFEAAPYPGLYNPESGQAEISALVGKRVEDLDVRAAGGLLAELDDGQLLEHVEPAGEFIPAHLRGSLLGTLPAERPLLLAVSVNGRIESITRTYNIKGLEHRFEALLPPASLRPGKNLVELHRIFKDHWKIALQSLTPADEHRWTLLERAGTEMLARGEQQYPLIRAVSAGQVISVPAESTALYYLAGNTQNASQEAPVVVVFLNGEIAGEEKSGGQAFSIAVNPGSGVHAAEMNARVFAIYPQASLALEMAYPPQCEPQWLFAAPQSWGEAICKRSRDSLLQPDGEGFAAHLDFGDPGIRPYLVEGWDLEDGGVSWTLGHSAGLIIPLPQGLQSLSFKARVKPFLNPPDFSSQTLWLLANDQPLQSWTLDFPQFEQIEWVVPRELLSLDPEKLHLAFLLPDAASPAAINAGADLRILGIAVHTMEIRGQ